MVDDALAADSAIVCHATLLKATGDERWAVSDEREVIAALVAEES